jgi:hypothetical protein
MTEHCDLASLSAMSDPGAIGTSQSMRSRRHNMGAVSVERRPGYEPETPRLNRPRHRRVATNRRGCLAYDTMLRTKRSARLTLLPCSQSKRRANAASAPATTR